MQALAVTEIRVPKFLKIHNEAMVAAHDFRTHYLRVFESLMLVEAEQIYQQFEVPSLFLYCTELLELSPNVANDFITVVRKSLEVPELATAIRERKVTISKARKVCPVITPTDFNQWIDLAAECSTRIVEKAVALAKPRSAVNEKMTYLTADVLEFKLAVSEEWRELLVKTKDQLSQKFRRAVSSEEALFILMRENFTKNDPVEKAKRAIADESKSKSKSKSKLKIAAEDEHQAKSEIRSEDDAKEDILVPSKKFVTRYRPALVEHIVNLRDQNQCAYIDSMGKRCEQRRWLHKHHIVEFAHGGAHVPENLETLCSGYHKIKHMQSSNIEKHERVTL